jgi:hypothetical protein
MCSNYFLCMSFAGVKEYSISKAYGDKIILFYSDGWQDDKSLLFSFFYPKEIAINTFLNEYYYQNKHWKKLGSLNTIPRHKAFIWRVIQNAIPVKTALAKRSIPCNTLCPRCFQKEETIDHVFMHCTHAAKTWCGSKMGIRFDQSHQNFSDWVIYAINSLLDEDLRYLAAIIYGIWFARNQWVFNQKHIEEMEIINKANTSLQDYIKATTSNIQQQSTNRIRSASNLHQSGTTNRNRRWQKPTNGKIKINSDTNLARAGRWGFGVICRDSSGALIAAAT